MAFPVNYDFTYYRGDTHEFNIALQNGDESTFSLLPYESYTYKIAEKRGSGVSQIIGTATRVGSLINCKITSTVGRYLFAGEYVYDVQIADTTPSPNIVYTVVTGKIKVIDDISGAS